MTHPRRPSARAAALAGGLALALGGCGMGEEAQTPQQIRLTPGAGGRIGTVAVRDAKIVFTGPVSAGLVYGPGQDAPLQLTVVNEGPEPDRLVSLSSPIAASGRVVGDARMPGGHGLVAGYDHPVSSATLPQQNEVDLTLAGVTTPIRSGLTYPVQLAFERAGVLRLDVPVEVPSDTPVPRADPPPGPAAGTPTTDAPR